MPRGPKIPQPAKFLEIKKELAGDNRSCAVVALAALLRVSPKQAQDALLYAGRKVNSGTYDAQIFKAARILGYELRPVGPLELSHLRKRYPKGRQRFLHFTTHHPRRFAAAWAEMPDMMLWVRGHVAAYVDGEVVDWSINSSKQIYRMVTAHKIEQ